MDLSQGWALVLGGGGTVGAAYEAGVLSALAEVGVDVHGADLIVGTSAGALIGTRLRCGATLEELTEVVQPRPRDLSSHPGPRHVEKAWRGRVDLARRAVSAGAIVAGTLAKVPLPEVSPAWRRAFPGGMMRVSDQELLEEMIPVEWPEDPLWIMAMDLRTRRRVAFGRRPGDTDHPLLDCVRASCAVTGLFEPVTIDGHHYVDGGTRSSTSLDFALHAGARRIIVVAPMCFDPATPPSRTLRLIRNPGVRELQRELGEAARGDHEVLVFHPTLREIQAHGNNLLYAGDTHNVVELARAAALEALAEPAAAELVERLKDRAA